MAWRRPGDKPLSETMMVSSPTQVKSLCQATTSWRQIFEFDELSLNKLNWCFMQRTVISLWPGDAMWHHRTGSTLAQVMACCLTAPSHFLNQCWLVINCFLWHCHGSNFIGIMEEICPWNAFENFEFNITSISVRCQLTHWGRMTHIHVCQ